MLNSDPVCDKQLRISLEEITKLVRSKQVEAINNLHNIYPHTIDIIEETVIGRPDTQKYNYTCFMYALNIEFYNQSNPIKEISREHLEIYISSDFLLFCINKGVLREVSFDEIVEGDIILYFTNEIPVHAGKILNSKRVISKWGQGGHLWGHAIWEIPAMYGTQASFYKNGVNEQITKCFLEYAEIKMKNNNESIAK